MHFAGKVALVTGAARGIGLATATALAEAGAQVVVVDIDGEQAQDVAAAINDGGGRAVFARCDVSSDEDVRALSIRVQQQVGTPDLLINNAFARQHARGGVDTLDVEAWRRSFDINVLGNVRMHRAFLPAMLERGSGHLVDTSSSLSIVPNSDTQGLLPYIASKGAILGAGYGLRQALAARGIGYSVFCPGLTDTQPAQERAAHGAAPRGAPPQHAAAILLAGIEQGQFLICSEPDFEKKIVQLAQLQLDPLPMFGAAAATPRSAP